MVFHVGYDSNSRNVCAFNTDTKNISYFETESRHWEVENILVMIKSKINGKLGCFCVYFDGRRYKMREKIIEYGYKHGFEKVELVDPLTSEFFGISLHTDFQPQNQDVIWIANGVFKFELRQKNFRVWIKENEKATYHGNFSFEDLILDDNFKPKVIYFPHETIDDKGIEKAKTKFPDCIIFTSENKTNAEIALIKARIMANDLIYKVWDAKNILNWGIVGKIGKKEIIHIKEYLSLPVLKKVEFTKTDASDVLSVIISYSPVKKYALPHYNVFDVTLHVDSNEIFTVEHVCKFSNLASKKPLPETVGPQFKPLGNKLLTKPYYHELAYKPKPKHDNNLENNTSKEKENTYVFPSKITTSTEIDAVGIDLGTSRCCAAVNRKNGIETVALDYKGERLLPSFVAYDEEHEKHGQVVVDRLRNYPKSTIFDSKRIIGRNFGDIEIDSMWPFKILNENGAVRMGVTTPHGEKFFSAEEVASSLLKYIKEKCESYQGKPLTKAVITVPASFTEIQKSSTLTAAKMAGFKDLQLLPEPIAASFAYFIDRPISNNSNVLLFDLGGGTLDVCIFKIVNDQIQIIHNGGDTKLGGRDFDTILINHFKNLLLTKYGISLIKNKKYKLMLECQKIKENLTSAATSSLDIEEYDASKDGLIPINREEFEKMTSQLLNRIKNTINAALYSSGIKADEIAKVLQVGGGSRMPMIKKLLLEIFPKADHICEEHPDEVVAVGAAYYAYSKKP